MFFVDGALDALLVDDQELEVAGLLGPGVGLSEGVIDLGDAGIVAAVLHTDSKHSGLDGAGTIEAPEVVGDRLCEGALEVGAGGQVLEGDFAVMVVGLLLFGGLDVELAGESVARGVEAAARFALGGLWTCRAVGTRGVDRLWFRHVNLLYGRRA